MFLETSFFLNEIESKKRFNRFNIILLKDFPKEFPLNKYLSSLIFLGFFGLMKKLQLMLLELFLKKIETFLIEYILCRSIRISKEEHIRQQVIIIRLEYNDKRGHKVINRKQVLLLEIEKRVEVRL